MSETVICRACKSVEVLLPEAPQPSATCLDCGAARTSAPVASPEDAELATDCLAMVRATLLAIGREQEGEAFSMDATPPMFYPDAIKARIHHERDLQAKQRELLTKYEDTLYHIANGSTAPAGYADLAIRGPVMDRLDKVAQEGESCTRCDGTGDDPEVEGSRCDCCDGTGIEG